MSFLKFSELDIKLDIDGKYLAHISVDNITKESLKEHINLVYDYFLLLVKENGVENHLDNLFEQSVGLLLEEDEVLTQKNEFANFVKYLFAKSIYWHDMGKMNPNFQVDKMGNEKFENIDLTEGSNHSPLGAYLFINHSLQELENRNGMKMR